MRETSQTGNGTRGVVELLSELKEDALSLVRGEVALAKAEMKAKVGKVSKELGFVAGAVAIGYAGVLLLLLGAGLLVSWGLSELGLSPFAAAAAGLTVAGILVVAVSVGVAVASWRKIQETGLVPEAAAGVLRAGLPEAGD